MSAIIASIKLPKCQIVLLLLFSFSGFVNAVEFESESSFAQEYQQLADLLNKVQDRQTAQRYYDQIVAEIQWLQSRQISGQNVFKQLSPSEKQNFIHRFQQNQFHCGVITQVHKEARRIMLNAETKAVLENWITQIP